MGGLKGKGDYRKGGVCELYKIEIAVTRLRLISLCSTLFTEETMKTTTMISVEASART